MIYDADILMGTIPDEEFAPLPIRQENIDDFSYVRTLTVGEGTNVIRANREGLWLGSKISTTAPFKVQPNGKVLIHNSSETGYVGMSPSEGFWLGASSPEEAFFRVTPEGKVYIKSTSANGGYIEIDGVNTRIIMHDGQVPRLIISPN